MKDKAIEILLREFQKNTYFKSIYLWGSITTDEFDPGSSDLDSIAIVKENTTDSEKEAVNKSIQSELSQLKVNFIYPSELNGGPSRGITRFVPIECILFDMPFWIHVAGATFKREDFAAGRKTIHEIISTSLANIRNRFMPEPKKEDLVYFIKALARLCYFIHQKSQKPKPFRYNDLIIDSSASTEAVCASIVEIKKSGWNENLISSKLPTFKEFIESL